MNSSVPVADERRAEAGQSIACTSSPGRERREPATSEPRPRRALCIAPNESPIRRRRGTSVKTEPAARPASHAGEQRAVFGPRPRRDGEAGPLESLERLVQADYAHLREEARPDRHAVDEYHLEQPLDVL